MAAKQLAYSFFFRRQVIVYMNKHCQTRNIKLTIIPGGLIPYREFKDKISNIINEWKHSDGVAYTRGGNLNHLLMKLFRLG